MNTSRVTKLTTSYMVAGYISQIANLSSKEKIALRRKLINMPKEKLAALISDFTK